VNHRSYWPDEAGAEELLLAEVLVVSVAFSVVFGSAVVPDLVSPPAELDPEE
jgi:hypothetical protein